jgi:multicomponent Na+:H+ antiporter subunit D
LAKALLLLVLTLPPAGAVTTARLLPGNPRVATRISLALAMSLVVAVTVTPLDAEIPLASGRALVLSPIGQLGIQLLGLAILGVIMGLEHRPAEDQASWLPVAWLSLTGLALSLVLESLPLALLLFASAALLWAVGLPVAERQAASGAVLRYAALVALAMPMLLLALRLAELRQTAAQGAEIAVETAVMAVALPGFGLVLGMIPLHSWTLTVASGAPRTMLIGAVALVQTAAFTFLLQTIKEYPWLTRGDYGAIITACGALTAAVGGWLALAADPDDPDDWLAYAAVANAGMLVAGIGTGSRIAGAGVVSLLFARVLGLVLVSLSDSAAGAHRRLAEAVATLTLAGTPLLAGFPGLWLIVGGTHSSGHRAYLGLVLGSGLLFATALRRGLPRVTRLAPPEAARGGLTVFALVLVLFLLGLVPQTMTGALADPLRDHFFPLP